MGIRSPLYRVEEIVAKPKVCWNWYAMYPRRRVSLTHGSRGIQKRGIDGSEPFFSIISSNDTMKDLYKKGFKKEDVLEALRILPFVSVSNLCFGCQRISMEILGRPKLIASCLKSTLP